MSKPTSALESSVLERIRTGNRMQNFSALLNSPEEPVTYFQGFKNMLYYSVYADESSFDFEMSKDIEKFSTVDIGSPRSLSSGHSAKISFKELLNENMDQYVNAIKPEYDKFKAIHCHSRKSIDNIDTVSALSEKSQIYQSNSAALKSIDKEFTVNEKDFKIKKELLSQKREFITHSNAELIEKCGRIERELETTLDFSHKMSLYISHNLSPLEDCVTDVVLRINKWKEMMNALKQNLLHNSTQLLLKGVKVNNSKQVLLCLDKVRKLKDIIELLKVLSANQKKFKLTLELITKGKEVISKLKAAKKPSLRVLTLFEEQFNEYSHKSCQQISTEFSSVLVEAFTNFVFFSEERQSCEEQYAIDMHAFRKLASSSQANASLLNRVTFPIANTSKIRQMTQFFISTDVIEALCLTIRSLITQVAIEAITSSLSRIKSEMTKDKNDSVTLDNHKATVTIIADSEKHEQLMLLMTITASDHLISTINSIKATVEQELTSIPPLSGINKLKSDFASEFNQIALDINTHCSSLIEGQLVKCLQEALGHSNIDAFVDNFYLVKALIKSQFKQEISLLIEKSEGEYVQKWLNSKESKFKSPLYENWEDYKEIPFNYQSNLDMILKYQLIKDKPFEECLREFQEMDVMNGCSDQLTWLTIGEVKVKANQCSLDIVKASFEVIKMLMLFSDKAWNFILRAYSALMRKYLTFQKEQVFDGRCSTVTQTEISMIYSIAFLIKEITSAIVQNDSKKLLQSLTTAEIYYNFKEDLSIVAKNVLQVSKTKISDLIDRYAVENSLKELYLIKLPHYPITEGEVPINAYALSLVRMIHSIYEAMVNAYDNDFIIKTISDALSKFFDKFEKYVFNGEKIEKEGSLKQFRRDMIFLKKNFGSLSLIDINPIKARIDSINKTVLPEAVRTTTTSSHREKTDN